VVKVLKVLGGYGTVPVLVGFFCNKDYVQHGPTYCDTISSESIDLPIHDGYPT